ncbi:MAG: formylglycine-generating enzyme family protein, partial [Pirellulales bacterium]|nr:formylglycine-generating enzyme family protein [Pirellulales bacterium]
MRRSLRKVFWNYYGASRLFWAGIGLAVVCGGIGWWLNNPYCFAGAAAAFYLLLARQATRRSASSPTSTVAAEATTSATPPDTRPSHDKPHDTESLVSSMLAQDRYALLLRPQLAQRLSAEQVTKAREALTEQMALVPGGTVVLSDNEPWSEDLDADAIQRSNDRAAGETTLLVEPAFLDRNAVTNRQYYEFVASGGYSQLALWDQGIWPAVVGFVDRTNNPGPRGWVDGRYLPGEEN